MSDISIILFKKDSYKIPDEHQKIIDNAIDNFRNTCSNPVEMIKDTNGTDIIVSKKVNIIKEVHPKGSLHNSTPESGVDAIYPIPIKALTRLFPNYVEKPYDSIDRLFISKGNEGFMIVNLNVQDIIKPSYHRGSDFYDYTKYLSIYQGFEEYHEYNPIFSEDGKEIDEDPFPNKDSMLIWIELICVSPESRGKSVGFQLIKVLEEYLLNNYSNDNIIAGLDIVGTKNRFQNLDLKNYYTSLNFKFPNIDFHTYHSGAQLGYKLIRGHLQ